MLFLLGQIGSQMHSRFSKVFKETITKELNEDNFTDFLPSMDRSTPILIEKGFTVGRHQEELLRTIKDRDMVVVKEKCKGDDDTLDCESNSKYVATKNSFKGRRQQVLVINDSNEFDASLQQFTEEDSHCRDEEDGHCKGEPARYWENLTTVRFPNIVDTDPSAANAPDWLNDRLRTGSVKAFCTVDVWQYATKTPRRKWIRFKLTDAVGMSTNMGSDDSWARGFFNYSAHLYLYPGGSDPNNSQLPSDWSRCSIQPKTLNSSTNCKYTSTTGWKFGVSPGGNPTGPHADITATHKEEDEEGTLMTDFKVCNISDESMTGWNFYYAAADSDNWRSHFTWDSYTTPVADLAKGALTLNAECLYRGPPDSDEVIPWNFRFEFEWACLRGHPLAGKWQPYKIKNTIDHSMLIDMGLVKNPEP